MPSVRRRARQRRGEDAELTMGQKRHLLTGSPFFSDGFATLEEFTEAWQIHGEDLLPEFIRDHPGRRPLAWWIVEHQQERPIVGDWRTDSIVKQIRNGNQEHFGFLHTEVFSGGEYLQQPEEDYLAEHGLLIAEEIAALDQIDHSDLSMESMHARAQEAKRQRAATLDN